MRGAGYFRRGAGFLADHPRLWSLVAAPLAITALLVGAGAWLALSRFDDLVRALMPMPSGWLGTVLWTVLYVLAVSSVALAGYFLFFAAAALIAAPFNELLSEAVEEIVTGRASPPLSLRRFARDLGLTLAHESRKIFHYLLLTLLLTAAGFFIPGIGWLIQLIGGGLVTARFCAYDALDVALARRGWSFARKNEFIRKHRGLAFGLGGAVGLLLLVPIANLLALPIGAVGGTLLFLDAHPEDPQ